jgi:peptidase M1 membrane alanine aminopeptidase
MHLDNTSHVELLAESLKEIAKDMENPAAKEMLKNVLDEGITIKRGLNQTESVKKQIKMLEEIKEMFK